MRRHALILAGGQSRRMGLNKLMLPRTASDATPIWQHVAKVVSACCDEGLILATPADALDTADADLPNLRVLADESPYLGPLQALAGAWPTGAGTNAGLAVESVLVVAADLPGLQPHVLEVLQAALAGDPEADGAVVVRDGQIQPLLGCYRQRVGEALVRTATPEARKLLPAFAGLTLHPVDGQALGWPAWWTRPVHTPEDYARWFQDSRRESLA